MNALKLVSSRQMIASLPRKVSASSTASMSSTSTERPVKKKESLRSWLATAIGGKMDSADEGAEPVDLKEVMLPHAVEQSTGEVKLFLLAFENGFLDPYCNAPVNREGRGTKDNPIPIQSFIDERMVACVCEPGMNYMKFSHVYRGEPKRCSCGFWMELVQAPKFWQKIPKEDLMDIPYFRDLDEEGKLDRLLAGEMNEEEERKALGIGAH